MHGVFAALPYAPYGRAELDRIRVEIERYRAPSPEWPRSSLNRPQRSLLPVHDIDHERAHIRWLRANLLDALGHGEEALRWYATFPDPAGNDLAYLAPAHLHRARIHERRGEARAALEHYARVVTIWRDADAGLQPLVDEAREGVARLSVEAGPLADP